jgi:protein AroM
VTGRGAAVVAVLCTGALAGLRCPRPLLQPGPLRQAAARLADWRPDLVVLDCLGLDAAMRQIVAEATGAPVILPRTALALAVATLV